MMLSHFGEKKEFMIVPMLMNSNPNINSFFKRYMLSNFNDTNLTRSVHVSCSNICTVA